MAFDIAKANAGFKAQKEREAKKRESALKYIREHNYIIDGEDVRVPAFVPAGYTCEQLPEAVMIEYAKALKTRKQYREDGSGRQVIITWNWLGKEVRVQWQVKVPQGAINTCDGDDEF